MATPPKAAHMKNNCFRALEEMQILQETNINTKVATQRKGDVPEAYPQRSSHSQHRFVHI